MKARAAQSGTCAEERTRALVPNWSRAGRGRACLNPPDPLCRPDVLRGAGLSTHGREHPTAVRGWPADPARDEWIATGHDHAAGRCRPAYDPRALGHVREARGQLFGFCVLMNVAGVFGIGTH